VEWKWTTLSSGRPVGKLLVDGDCRAKVLQVGVGRWRVLMTGPKGLYAEDTYPREVATAIAEDIIEVHMEGAGGLEPPTTGTKTRRSAS
jgi:hypothetical protein